MVGYHAPHDSHATRFLSILIYLSIDLNLQVGQRGHLLHWQLRRPRLRLRNLVR